MRKALFVLLGCACLAGCRKNQAEGYEYLESVLFTRVITPEEMLAKLEEYIPSTSYEGKLDEEREELDRFAAKAPNITAYGISYRTVNPFGEPTVASGVVYVPALREPGNPVIESPPFSRSKFLCVSRQPDAPDLAPAFTGHICLVSDQIGAGSSEDQCLNTFQHENIVRVAADFRKAAWEFLWRMHGIRLSSDSIICGYSLGGSSALAMARYYDLHPEEGVRVKELWTGGGAYYLSTALSEQIEEDYSETALMPSILWSLNHYLRLNLDFDSIFLDPVKDHPGVYTGEISFPVATEMLGTQISAYLNFDVFGTGKPVFNQVMEAIQVLDPDVRGWTPAYPVHLYHARDDKHVPRVCSDMLYEALSGQGVRVQYTQMDVNHIAGSGQMYMDFLQSLVE